KAPPEGTERASGARGGPLGSQSKDSHAGRLLQRGEHGRQALVCLEQSLPGIQVLGTMKVAVGDVRKLFARNHREEIPAAPDLPQVHQLPDDPPPVPEIKRVRVELAHLVRVTGHRDRSPLPDFAEQVQWISVGGEKLVQAESEDVNGSVPV